MILSFSPSLRKYIAEFIGTFALVFIAAGSNAVDHISHGILGLTGMAIATGVTVMVMIYAIGHISGAHINPAVTIAMSVTGKMGTRDSFAYIVSQVAGACEQYIPRSNKSWHKHTPAAGIDNRGSPNFSTGLYDIRCRS